MTIDPAPPYRVTLTARGDRILYNPNDVVIGRSFDLYGEFSARELRILLSLAEGTDTVVDAGANIGAFTVPLSRVARRVVAFEPQRLVFQMLCANLALNARTNVLAMPAALAAEPGTMMRMAVLDPKRRGNFGGTVGRIESGAEAGTDTAGGQDKAARPEVGDPVHAMALDDLGLTGVALIKIDVEGMERDVLLGAGRTIARDRPLLHVENERADRSPALIRTLRDLGYACYWRFPPLFSPDNPRGNRDDVFAGMVSVNMLCLPADRFPQPPAGLARSAVGDPEETWQAAWHRRRAERRGRPG